MGAASRTSIQAATALLAGLLSVACGVLAIASRSDLFLLSLFGDNRIKGLHAAFADGSVRFVRPTTNEATLREAIIRNDGKTLGPDW